MNKYWLLLLLPVLVACSPTVKKVDVKGYTQIHCGKKDNISKLILYRIKWVDVKDGTGRVWLALDGDNYTKLSFNMQGVLKGVVQLKGINNKLLTCIEKYNSVANKSPVT